MNGIELQDREFFAAIKEKREPNASVAQVLPAMQTLDRLEKSSYKANLRRPAVPCTYGRIDWDSWASARRRFTSPRACAKRA